MTDGEKIANAILMLISAQDAVSKGAGGLDVLNGGKEAVARAIDDVLKQKATVSQAMGFGLFTPNA